MAIERRPGERPFLARVYVGGRKGPSRAFHTRHEAEAWHASARMAMLNGESVPGVTQPVRNTYTVHQACRDTVRAMLDGTYRTKQGRQYRQASVVHYEIRLRLHVLPRIGGMLLADVDRAALMRLRESLLAVSESTTRDAMNALRVVIRRAIEHGVLDHDPTTLLPPLSVSREAPMFLTRARARGLQARADAYGHLTLGLFVALGLGTGARRGELQALRWEDVRGHAIHITRSMDGNGKVGELKTAGARRTVPVGPSLWARLEDARATGYVIGRYPVKPWRKVRPRGMRVHDLRHTAATFWLAAGMNVHEVADLLGHADASMVLRLYGHALPSRLSIAGDVMDAFLGGVDGGAGHTTERMLMDGEA